MGGFTSNFNLYKPAVGETGWGALVNVNWDTIDANLVNGLPRAYLAGAQTSLSGGTPSTVIAITAGDAQDAGNAGAIRLAAAITKNINATWLVGSGNGGLATALTLTASTTYHLYLIKRTDTGVVDAYFDTSTSAANIPSPYTLFRRISSHRTDANKLLFPYTQNGDYFRLERAAFDQTQTNPGTNAGTVTFTSIPTGFNMFAMFNAVVENAGAAGLTTCYFSDLAVADQAPSLDATAPLGSQEPAESVAGASRYSTAQQMIRTDTASRIRFRFGFSDANVSLHIATLGWWDSRGTNG